MDAMKLPKGEWIGLRAAYEDCLVVTTKHNGKEHEWEVSALTPVICAAVNASRECDKYKRIGKAFLDWFDSSEVQEGIKAGHFFDLSVLAKKIVHAKGVSR